MAVGELIRLIHKRFMITGGRKIRVSVNGFIPKPFTDFEDAPMCREKDLRKRRKMIALNIQDLSGIELVPKNTGEELLQAILSLGNEDTGLAMYHMVSNQIVWKQAMKDSGVSWEQIFQPGDKREKTWSFIQAAAKNGSRKGKNRQPVRQGLPCNRQDRRYSPWITGYLKGKRRQPARLSGRRWKGRSRLSAPG